MAKDCWCGFTFHIPGEKHRHLKAQEKTKSLLRLAEESEKRTGKVKKKNGSNS